MLLPGKIDSHGEKVLILKVFRCIRKSALPRASSAGVLALAPGRTSVSEQLKGGEGRQREPALLSQSGSTPRLPHHHHLGELNCPRENATLGSGLSTCARAGVGSSGFGEALVKAPASNAHHTSLHPHAPGPALSRPSHAAPSTLKTQTGHSGPYLPTGKNWGRESGAEDERPELREDGRRTQGPQQSHARL